MKSLKKITLALSAFGLAGMVNAAGYGVIDLEKVVESSTYLKQQNTSLEQSIKPQTQKLEALAKEIETLQKSSTEKNANMEQLTKQYQAKVTEYQTISEGVQTRVKSTIQTTNQTFEARVKQVAEQLRQEGNLDLILNKNAAIAFDAKYDLTAKMIQKVNAIK